MDNHNLYGMDHQHHQHHQHHLDDGDGDFPSLTMSMAVNDVDDTLPQSSEDPFCISDMGMVMYMDGFRWTLKRGTSCLNFFFPSWTLDTLPKFIFAMVCVVAMGIATEGISRWKHDVAQKSKRALDLRRPGAPGNHTGTNSGRRLRRMHTCLRGLSILSAYLLMLVIMTYSLELFCCAILGLMIGHFFFDNDSLHHGGGTLCCEFLEGGGSGSPEGGDGSLAEALIPRTPSGENEVSSNGADYARAHSCCDDDTGVGEQSRESVI
mmetsp:Transcript_3208/g.7321  ORF Transcript_3208/g.7321 Transcript_3208/m.7321 type:complete len:265 (+) Transcript_3208:98-892(+)